MSTIDKLTPLSWLWNWDLNKIVVIESNWNCRFQSCVIVIVFGNEPRFKLFVDKLEVSVTQLVQGTQIEMILCQQYIPQFFVLHASKSFAFLDRKNLPSFRTHRLMTKSSKDLSILCRACNVRNNDNLMIRFKRQFTNKNIAVSFIDEFHNLENILWEIRIFRGEVSDPMVDRFSVWCKL